MSQVTDTIWTNLLIRASAGTGKTFQLTNRYLNLLAAGESTSHVLATTFTRKAAHEILDRLLLRLAHACRDGTAREELAAVIQKTPIMQQECEAMLEKLVTNLHRVRIGTLDSFFAQIARSFSLELGLPSRWQIVEEVHDQRIRADAVQEILSDDNVSSLRTLLNLLSKGDIRRNINGLVHDTVDGLYDLYLETPREAWFDVPRHKPLGEQDLADALEQLREVEITSKQLARAKPEDYQRALQGNWDEFLGKGLAKKISSGVLTYYRTEIPAELVQIYQPLIDHAAAELIGLVAMQTEATYELLDRFHAVYQQRKTERGVLRFDDVTRSLANFEQTLSGGVEDSESFDDTIHRLAFRLDGQIRHLLLDEFQDTAPAQWQVLAPLARQVTRSSTQDSFFCVGDVKQAIYGWRGGVAEIFEAISDQLTGLTDESFNTSYRSSQVIVDTVNRIFQNLVRHTDLSRAESAVSQWSQRFRKHATAKESLPGYAVLATSPQGEDNLRFAASQVAKIVQDSPGREVGVLVRTNAAVGRLIYELRRQGVRASEEGGNPLTDSAGVRLILSILRLADHPGDQVALFHVAHSVLGVNLQLTDHTDVERAIGLSCWLRQKLMDEGYGRTIGRLVQYLLEACNQREQNRLEQFVDLAYRYDSISTLRTDDFIDYVTNQKESDPAPADVRVMNIHQAKGLEFDIVVLPELSKGLIGNPPPFVVRRKDPMSQVDRVCRYTNQHVQQLLPPSWQAMFDDSVEQRVNEALCVLYVAVTRARCALYMFVEPSQPNEKKVPATYAGLLRVALANSEPAEENRLLYEQGDPHWYRDSQAPSCRVDPMEREVSVVDRVSLAPGKGRRRGLARTSPSSMEGGGQVTIGDVLELEGVAARSRGTLIHAWFEQIQWLDEGSPDDTHLRRIAGPLISDQKDLEDALHRFYEILKNPTIVSLLSRTEYMSLDNLPLAAQQKSTMRTSDLSVKVRNEHRFALREGDAVITGSIDRLVFVYSGDELVAADVIDFKTDRVSQRDPEVLAEKVAYYMPQLNAYRQAVSQLGQLPVERIAARLLFVNEGLIYDV